MNALKSVKNFITAEPVLVVTATLTIISMFLSPPSADYIGYIDFSVIALLFCLMAIVALLREAGVLRLASEAVTSRISSSRTIVLRLVLLCFFSSMLITNDVALITFVPLTIGIFARQQRLLIPTIVLETIASNLGSALTPVGNPQNLFLYSFYKLSAGEFFAITAPLCAVSLVLIIIGVIFVPKAELTATADGTSTFVDKSGALIGAVLFLVAIFTVLRVLSWQICLVAVLIALLVFNRKIFREIDYFLLITFVCFFIFVGNLSAIPAVEEFIGKILLGNELFASVAISQVISNVPCSATLSAFTNNYAELLLGVNIGGLGTPVASLASLISMKLYGRSEGAQKGRYLAVFTLFNFAMLLFLLIFASVAM